MQIMIVGLCTLQRLPASSIIKLLTQACRLSQHTACTGPGSTQDGQDAPRLLRLARHAEQLPRRPGALHAHHPLAAWPACLPGPAQLRGLRQRCQAPPQVFPSPASSSLACQWCMRDVQRYFSMGFSKILGASVQLRGPSMHLPGSKKFPPNMRRIQRCRRSVHLRFPKQPRMAVQRTPSLHLHRKLCTAYNLLHSWISL